MRAAARRFFNLDRPNVGRVQYISRLAPTELFAGVAPSVSTSTIPKPDELDWWDWTNLLLQAAAEVEHALLVQYLYAAYSLAPGNSTGSPPANAAALVTAWRRTLVRIAREEMAHLLTVQNLLHVIGASPSLDRQPFPSDSPLQPFPFVLEPLTSGSLAKYVVAEMPSRAEAEIPQIIAEAEAAAGQPVKRVGPLYMTLVDIFQDPAKLADEDLDFSTATTLQAVPADWDAASNGLLGGLIDNRPAAVTFLTSIGEQGEGPWTAPIGAAPSHFDRFLEIYRAYPGGGGATPVWTPTNAVPVNPVTEQDGTAGSIREPASRLWALFANVRYRMLLTSIAHGLSIPGPVDSAGTRTARGNLVDWAFEEMAGRSVGGLRGLAELLSGRPLVAAGQPGVVGLPFELPYSTSLPPDEKARWRLHRALIDTAETLATRLRSAGEDGPILQEYAAIDADRRAFLKTIH